MDYQIAGRVALVTGSSQGIGLETARLLAQEGAKVCLSCRDIARGEAALQTLTATGATAILVPGDVADPETVERLFSESERRLGPVDILVNNAAISPKVRYDAITPEDFDRVLRVNLTAAFACCQRALDGMIRRGWGRIVNVGSSAARYGTLKAGAHYAASKAGLMGLTRTLVRQLEQGGDVTVNCVVPSRVNTAMSRALPPEALAEITKKIPLGRLAEPQEVAEAIVFLASQRAGYITGACVDLKGGNPA